MAKKKNLYAEMGVTAIKTGIGETFKGIINNQFPLAFCNIIIDPLSGYACTLKMDGTGSKPVIRHLYYLETGINTFDQDPFDGYTMVAGDAGASGLLTQHKIADTLDVNGFNVCKDLLVEGVKKGMEQVIALYRSFGINVFMFGGETADLPIQSNSQIFNMAMEAAGPREEVVTGEIQPGDRIYGLASNGKAVWEDEENSGIMCNGLTLAAAVLLDASYAEKYPHLTHPTKPYRGKFFISDRPEMLKGQSIGQALLSPTRQWAIIMKMIVEKLKKRQALHLLHGMTMNTGGGNTKILRLGKNIHYKKAIYDYIPPIFKLIKFKGKIDWREMFQDFNCGIGVDIIGSPEGNIIKEVLTEIDHETGVQYFFLGECGKSKREKNTLSLYTPYGLFRYLG